MSATASPAPPSREPPADGAPSGPGCRARRWMVLGHLAAILVIGGYAAFLAMQFHPAIAEPDDSGYFSQGSLLARTGHTFLAPGKLNDAQYVGIHWLLTPWGGYVNRYPPGLPVLIAVAFKIGGYKAAAAINPLLAIGALIGLYLLSRRMLPPLLALCALVVVALNPTFTHHALSGYSHMAVTFCLLWAIYFMTVWSTGGKLWQAGLAGLFIGCIPAIRYGDGIMALGALAFFLCHIRRPGVWRHYLAALIGSAIPIVPLLIHNQLLMGAFWRTGYLLTNEQSGFSIAYFRTHLVDYLQQAQGGGIGLFFGLGLIGMIWMIGLRRTRAMGLLLLLATLSMLLVYAAYYWAPQAMMWVTMRFLLPTFPLYVIAGAWALAEGMQQAPAPARVAVPLAAVALQLIWGTSTMTEQLSAWNYERTILADVTDALQKHVPANAVVLADGQILQDLDFVRIWKPADISPTGLGGNDSAFVMINRGPVGEQDPWPMQAEKDRITRAKYAGTTRQRIEKFMRDLTAWGGSDQVYFVGTRGEMEQTFEPLGRFAGNVAIIADHIPLPPQPPDEPGGLAGASPDALPGMLRRAIMNSTFGGSLDGQKEFLIAKWIVPKN